MTWAELLQTRPTATLTGPMGGLDGESSDKRPDRESPGSGLFQYDKERKSLWVFLFESGRLTGWTYAGRGSLDDLRKLAARFSKEEASRPRLLILNPGTPAAYTLFWETSESYRILTLPAVYSDSPDVPNFSTRHLERRPGEQVFDMIDQMVRTGVEVPDGPELARFQTLYGLAP